MSEIVDRCEKAAFDAACRSGGFVCAVCGSATVPVQFREGILAEIVRAVIGEMREETEGMVERPGEKVDAAAQLPAGWRYLWPAVEGYGSGLLERIADRRCLLAARNPMAWPYQIEECEATEDAIFDSFSRLLKEHE